ncbi:hypothetical protein [Alienimonas sp. DA493]|uniref:hypothetical protein n=1 Tax=Alienimonas sp. DA493 TaxID=3373605 RepID=UPI0037546F5D
MLRSTLTLAATGALLLAGTSQADAGDRPQVSLQLSLSDGPDLHYRDRDRFDDRFAPSGLYGRRGGYGSSFDRGPYGYGCGAGGGYGFGRGYGAGYGSRYGVWDRPPYGRFGRRPYGDCVGPAVVPHGDHFDLLPGRYHGYGDRRHEH